jgi:protein-tyrosine phosphatase
MDYIFGSFYILKNKVYNFDLEKSTQIVPRMEPVLPWYKQYSYFYSTSNQIINGLFLGSSFNAYCLNELKANNIGVVINVTWEIDNYHENTTDIKYYKFPVLDDNNDDIVPILTQTYDIIDRHLTQGDNILVHCYMGASRSASVIIYYLMNKNNWTYNQARTYVSAKRPLVNLSQKFNTILKSFEMD